MDEYLKHLENEQRERHAELEHLKSGSVTYSRRGAGAIEFEDLVPREIALLERDIALYEPLIAQLRAETQRCAG